MAPYLRGKVRRSYLCPAELDVEGRDALFPFFLLTLLCSGEPLEGKEISGAGFGVGVNDLFVGDALPVLAPIAVHHFPE